MKVKAAPGSKCPMEGKPRAYITDAEACEVPETSYYKRLIVDGSLVLAPAPVGQKTKKEVTTDGQ
jgi:hypothetical protein